MSALAPTSEYEIRIEPLDERVRAFAGETLIADSTRAKVMYETRLKPVVYFPPRDVKVDLGHASSLRTFCPFKGTATYGHIREPNLTAETGWWTYANAVSEAKAVEGHIGFSGDFVSRMEFDGSKLEPAQATPVSGPLVDWLLLEAGQCKSPVELTQKLAERMRKHGIAVTRLSIMISSLHPLIVGSNYVWRIKDNSVSQSTPGHDLLTQDNYVNSPLRHVSDGLGGVRQRLDGDELEFSFPIMDDLKAEGATDYVAMPLVFSDGQINVLTLACDQPGGFTTAQLGQVFEMLQVIARYFETFTLHDNSRTLLHTYLGPRTGNRVLGGEIKRGDGEEIDAAILFADLRDSTALELGMNRRDYLVLLNEFFELATDAITEQGGEVLKFIGDAVLAVFPSGEDAPLACRKAAEAATSMVAALRANDKPLECAIGAAFGSVTWGNVGSRDRLDFTVIGTAANVAARLADCGKKQDVPIIVTQDIAQHLDKCRSLGDQTLHNLRDPVPAYVIDCP